MADVAIKKLQSHTWYLTPEVVIFSLCSDLPTDEEKQKIAKNMLSQVQEDFPIGRPKLPALNCNTELADLVTPVSWFIFRKLKLTGRFLMLPVSAWKGTEEYKVLHQYVSTIKVVNDAAERGIKLCSEVIQKITTDERTRENLIQVIQHHRKVVKEKRNDSVLEGLSKLSQNNNI